MRTAAFGAVCVLLVFCSSSPAQKSGDDGSLTLAEYKRLGVPDLDHDWDEKDLMTAAKALLELAQTQPGSAPRRKSYKSRKLFKRISDLEIVDQWKTSDVPLKKRLPSVLEATEAARALLQLYTPRDEKTRPPEELYDMLSLQLRLSALAADLAAEYQRRLPSTEASTHSRLVGIARLRIGLSQLASGALRVVAASSSVELDANKRLIGTMLDAMPRLAFHMLDSDARKVVDDLKTLTKMESMHEVQSELAAVKTAVETALLEEPATPFRTADKQTVAEQKRNAELAKAVTMHRSGASGKPDSDGWYLAKSTKGEFSVRLPAAFNDFSFADKDASDGVALATETVTTRTKNGAVYTASSYRRADDTPKRQRFDDFGEDYKKAGALVSQKDLTVAGFPAKEVLARTKAGAVAIRVIQADDRSFSLTVEYPARVTDGEMAQDVERFFNSFTAPAGLRPKSN